MIYFITKENFNSIYISKQNKYQTYLPKSHATLDAADGELRPTWLLAAHGIASGPAFLSVRAQSDFKRTVWIRAPEIERP
jgi:hypothetical protein